MNFLRNMPVEIFDYCIVLAIIGIFVGFFLTRHIAGWIVMLSGIAALCPLPIYLFAADKGCPGGECIANVLVMLALGAYACIALGVAYVGMTQVLHKATRSIFKSNLLPDFFVLIMLVAFVAGTVHLRGFAKSDPPVSDRDNGRYG